MVPGNAVDRRQIAAKLELIAEHSRVFGNVRVKIARPLGKAAGRRPIKGIDVREVETTVIPVPLIFDQIYIHIDPVGAHNGRASLQRLAATVPRWDGTFLVLGSQIVIVKEIVTARE